MTSLVEVLSTCLTLEPSASMTKICVLAPSLRSLEKTMRLPSGDQSPLLSAYSLSVN